MFLLQASGFALVFLGIAASVIWSSVRHSKAGSHKVEAGRVHGRRLSDPAVSSSASGYGRSYTGGGYGYSRRSEAYRR